MTRAWEEFLKAQHAYRTAEEAYHSAMMQFFAGEQIPQPARELLRTEMADARRAWLEAGTRVVTANCAGYEQRAMNNAGSQAADVGRT